MKKIKVEKVKQRNPFVALAKFRKSGVHQKTTKAMRRASKMELSNQLA